MKKYILKKPKTGEEEEEQRITSSNKPLYDELESILSNARQQCVLRTRGKDIASDLLSLGVCFVEITGPDPGIRAQTVDFFRQSFGFEDMTRFFQVWTGEEGVGRTGVVGASTRMPNKPPIKTEYRSSYTYPTTGTIHCINHVNAKNNLYVWNLLPEEFHPKNWYGKERFLVPEDGFKFSLSKAYNTTSLHYDGQLGISRQGQVAPRVQVAYVEDSGPACLFAVPGSNSDRAREIIALITNLQPRETFVTLKKKKFPDLYKLLYRYGVTLGAGKRGLVMFNSNVWHYEAGAVNQDNGLAFYSADARTAESNVFRVYCGVMEVPRGTSDERLIRFAYLRLNEWAMDPYADPNKMEPTFVNHKSTQSYKTIIGREDAVFFNQIKEIGLLEMIAFLRQQDPKILLLLGLNYAALGAAVAAATNQKK